VVISWPNPSTGFVLQEAGALATPSSNTIWNNHGGTAVVNGADKQVTIPAPVGNRYFRLRNP
jgi:hypothetical protein